MTSGLKTVLVLCFILTIAFKFGEGKFVKIKQKGRAPAPAPVTKPSSSESEEGEDDGDVDAGELEDRAKCVQDINTCVDIELAYNPAAIPEKTKEICTKHIKIMYVCGEFRESWRFPKTTTKRPKKKPKTTLAPA